MPNYIAVIHKDSQSDYGVMFPDFPGCITAGRTVDEAKDMAQEALELHVEGMREDGESLPAASSLEAVVAGDDAKDAVAFFLVHIRTESSRQVRFNASIDALLLERIDLRAKEMGLSRSGFLTRAAWNELGR